MATKKNELLIDELLDSVEPKAKNKDNKLSNQAANDWGGAEEESYRFEIAGGQQGAKKTQKKKQTAKEWGELENAQKDQPKAVDFTQIQADDAKRRIIKKPGQSAKTAVIDTNEEYFPSLGEDRPKQAPKKNPEPAPVQQTSNDGFSVVTGPKKFVNAKKTGAGESFAPLNPTLVEKPAPVQAPVREKVESSEPAPSRGPGIFQRKADEPQEVPSDSKFKFGGEGPRKFVTGNKISFKREEEKDDHEALRLQREREIEEKIQREKEELAKQREPKKRPEGEKKERNGPSDGAHEGGDERKIARFSNPKKEAEKHHHAPYPHPEKQAVVEEKEEEKPGHAKETVEMHGALSNKAWGDGPILKKKK